MGRYGKEQNKGKRDFSLPRYNYLGPGNSLKKGLPTNKNDAIAYKHDLRYDEYIKRKKNPYINWSSADHDAQTQFTDDDYGGFLGRNFFGIKRKAFEAGLIGSIDTERDKRLRGSIEPAVKELAQAKDLSFNNLQTEVNMADGEGSGQDGNLKETPVDRTPRYLPTGPEDYTFSKLPFTQIKNWKGAAFYSVDHAYRMTSPYDPEVTRTTTAAGGQTGAIAAIPQDDSSDITQIKANWFDYYAGMYNYYHVVRCDWSAYIENTGGEPLYVHQMYYNEELPPTGATNADIMSWEGVRTRILQAPYKSVDSANGGVLTNEISTAGATSLTDNVDENDNNTSGFFNFSAGNNFTNPAGTTTCQLSGSYSPGQFRREVNLDSLVENWTLVSTNPSLPERLLLRLMPENPGLAGASVRGDQVAFKLFFKAEYTVEFKELKTGLRWPVQRQPILVTVFNNVTANTA